MRDWWESLMELTICRWFGHHWSVPKMHGLLCSRCRRYKSNYAD